MPRHPPCALKNFDTLQYFTEIRKPVQEQPPQRGSSRPVLNIWDARVHCAVLKQRTTRRHPARLPPSNRRGTVHTSPRPVSIKTTNPQTATPTRPTPREHPPRQADCLRTQQCACEPDQPPPPTFPHPTPKSHDPEESRPRRAWCVLAGRRDANPILLVNVPPMSNHQTLQRCLRWSA